MVDRITMKIVSVNRSDTDSGVRVSKGFSKCSIAWLCLVAIPRLASKAPIQNT